MLKKLTALSFFLISYACFSQNAKPPEATLKIESGDQIIVFTTRELLKRKDTETLSIPLSDYPNQHFKVKAVPAASLFKSVKLADDAVIVFSCLDGFSAPLEKARLLGTDSKGAIAYIAIEPPDKKWPNLSGKKQSAGPFYLVWKNPELSEIGREEWPFQLAGFKVAEGFAALFPKVMPAKGVEKSDTVWRGFEVFKKNCFVCHTMNGQGTSKMGPDLNEPMNPITYFNEKSLKMLVRDPASLRKWPGSKMPGFPASILNDTDLDALVDYLKSMAVKN